MRGKQAIVLVARLAREMAGAVTQRLLGGADGLQHAQAVLVDVDARSSGAQPIGALVQPHAPAALRQRAGRGQPCETPADDFCLTFHLVQNTVTCSTSASPSLPRGNPAASPTGKPAPARHSSSCTASARARRAG